MILQLLERTNEKIEKIEKIEPASSQKVQKNEPSSQRESLKEPLKRTAPAREPEISETPTKSKQKFGKFAPEEIDYDDEEDEDQDMFLRECQGMDLSIDSANFAQFDYSEEPEKP